MAPLRPSAPALNRLRRLSRRRSSRREEGCYLIDGPTLVAEALDASADLEAVYAEPGADEALIRRLAEAGTDVVPVAESSLRKVLDLVNPQSLVAVARQRPSSLDQILGSAARSHRPALSLVGLQDPGNAGTLLRVAEAGGCVGVILTEGSVDPWNPKVVRSSAGSVLRMPVCDGVPAGDLLDASGERGLPTIVTVAEGGAAPENVAMSGSCVLMVGSESHGVPPEVVSRATASVSIPMEGSAESLNAAVAGALVVFEAARQRRRSSDVSAGDA